MEHKLIRRFLIVCVATTGLAAAICRADSLEFKVNTTDAGTPVSQTVKGSNLIDLTNHMVDQNNEFSAFSGRAYTASIKYLGVNNALQYSSNASGTSVTLTIPKTGFTRTFTGATANNVQNQIEDFLKGNVSDAYSAFQKSINASSKIAPMDGNPQAVTAWLNSGAFSRFAFEPVSSGRAFELGGGADLNVKFDYTYINTTDGNVQAFDVAIASAVRFNQHVALTLAVPFGYHTIEGSDEFIVGGEIGLPIQIITPDSYSDFAIGWRVSPFANIGSAVTVDLVAGGLVAGGGVNSALDFYFGRNTTITIGDQVAYFTGIPVDYNDYEFDSDVDQLMLRNGVKLTQRIGSYGFVDVGVIYTNFLSGDTAIDNYVSPIAGIGVRFGKNNASEFRVGYHGDFADGYNANGADLLLTFSW